jgi:hypothetical protein
LWPEQHGARIGRGTANDALGRWIKRVEPHPQRVAERREVGLRDHQRVGHRRLPRRLRRKLEDDPQNPSLIKTVRGSGYIFTPTVEMS